MTAQPRGGRRWGWWFALALLVVPSIEIAVIVWVGSQIGGWPTLGLLLAESAYNASTLPCGLVGYQVRVISTVAPPDLTSLWETS